MNKKTFLEQLRKELKGLPEEETRDIIADYEEHFAIGKKKRRKEEAITKELGSPKSLGKQHKAVWRIEQAEKKHSTENVLKAVLATIGLGFFNLVVVLGPFAALVAVLLALFAAGIGISAAGIALIFGSLAAPFLHQYLILSGQGTIGLLFLGIGTTALGLLMLIGTAYLGKGFAKITIAYLRFNVQIITGKRGEEE